MGNTVSQPVLAVIAFLLGAGAFPQDLQVTHLADVVTQWGHPVEVDWENNHYIIQTVGYCSEEEDVLCRRYHKKEFKLNKSTWETEEIGTEEIDYIDTGHLEHEEKHLHILDVIGGEPTDDYIFYERLSLNEDIELQVHYKRTKYGHQGKVFVSRADQTGSDVIVLHSSILLSAEIHELEEPGLVLILKTETCGASACNSGLHFYRIDAEK